MMSSQKTSSLRAMIESLESRVLFANQVIWVEGESPTSDTFNNGWIQGAANMDSTQLSPGIPGQSNGAWIGHWATAAGSAQAVYNFNVPEAGTYTFWVRVQSFAYAGDTKYSYKLDNGSFVQINTADIASQQNLHAPNTGDFSSFDGRVAGWAYVGPLTLTAGSHSVTIRIANTYGELVGGIDVLAMTNYPWAPSGPLKPNPNATPSASDWFAFGAGPDQFSSNSIIDLSYLNEDTAGSHGPVKRQGAGYVFEDGTPVKFWGIDAGPVNDAANIAAQARWYAKHGINIVRLAHFDGYFDASARDAQGSFVFNAASMDRFDRFFAELKNNGIYMDWSMVWQTPILPVDGYPTDLYNELPWVDSGNQAKGKNSYGYVNFMPKLQEIRWKFVSALLNRVNPYTGIKYAADPALAVVEVQNEDDIFFWTPLSNVVRQFQTTTMPKHKAEMQRQWQVWLKAKYGTTAAMQAAWGTGFRAGSADGYGPDGVDNLNMKIYDAWEMEAGGLPTWEAHEQKRLADFMKYLGDTQRSYYTSRIQQIRNLGYKGVTVTTNWLPGGAASKAPVLWTDDAADAIDRHTYWGEGEGSWRIVTYDADGDGKPGEFASGSMLYSPGGGLLNPGMNQWETKPFHMSEWSSVAPNQYKAEALPLMAVYGMGLQGWDASFHFASGRYYYGNGWGNTIYTGLYNSDTPHYMGQFPALALAVRQGHIAEGGAAAARRISYDNAFSGKDAFTQSLINGGWNGATGNLAIPNEVMAIGRVSNQIGNGLPSSQKVNWDTYWNQNTKVVNSTTGELSWDYGNGIVQIRTPQTQGIIGFAGGKTFDLPDFTVSVSTNFVSLLFTALDGKPIAQSSKILVTAMARDKQYGAQYSADGTQLLTMGGEPLMMEPVQASITFKSGGLQSVRGVDVYGVPYTSSIATSGSSFDIDGRYATYYYQITRQTDSVAPNVSSVVINGGNSSQRSMVTKVTVTFSEQVTLEGNAIGLTLSTGAAIPDTLYDVDAVDARTYEIAFHGSGVVGESLADGRYRVQVLASAVQDVAGNVMAGNYSTGFHRLFGDADGDRDVDNLDLFRFRQSLNRPASYVWYFDFDDSKTVDNLDYVQLRQRMTKTVLG